MIRYNYFAKSLDGTEKRELLKQRTSAVLPTFFGRMVISWFMPNPKAQKKKAF